MCDPVTITAAALTAAGTGLSFASNQQVAGARDDALAAERIRQQGFDQQASALSTRSQDRYEGFDQKQEQKAQKLGDYFTGQQAQAPAPSLMPQSDSNIVVANEAAKRGEAKARTDQIGNALGDMRAFGDLLGDTSRLQGRDASQIGQIGGFKKGSSNVLSYELEDANNAGAGLALAGQIASGLGRVGMNAGLSGGGGGLFGGGGAPSPMVSPGTYGASGSRALGGALDRASMPGYAGYQSPNIFSLFGG